MNIQSALVILDPQLSALTTWLQATTINSIVSITVVWDTNLLILYT